MIEISNERGEQITRILRAFAEIKAKDNKTYNQQRQAKQIIRYINGKTRNIHIPTKMA